MDYHITVGTYGTRLHGDDEPTVERPQNQYGDEFVKKDIEREQFERDRMVQEPVYFTEEQRFFVEKTIPAICERGKWIYHIAACQTNHFHLLVSTREPAAVPPKQIRRWLKQWLTNALNEHYGKRQWFAGCGSTKYLFEKGYFEAVYNYIKRQRTTKE
jgi:REP element-mobilizing transposase RayT